ncbi:ubiquitin-like protein 4A-B [Macrosteles quadrilineatus]|uniref:ubiquitin-like protein 4A-B n=1 Tax=Macrosteles quadrilineatus TaxID=74068 RepID=UPI0023E34EF3|nr:ubiquitin-like protein 4A-B [Macrosteles quadrilineatus]
MKIKIKVFQGQLYTLEVDDQTRVSEVKEQMEVLLGVPADQQKLLIIGRPLSDEKLLSDYPAIKEGTKLNLIVKKGFKTNNFVLSDNEDLSILKEAAFKYLSDFYPEEVTRKIVDEFGKEFLRTFSGISLEEVEMLAGYMLLEEGKCEEERCEEEKCEEEKEEH